MGLISVRAEPCGEIASEGEQLRAFRSCMCCYLWLVWGCKQQYIEATAPDRMENLNQTVWKLYHLRQLTSDGL